MAEASCRQDPLVSVVLATFDEAGSVRACIDSLLRQDTPGFNLEVLVIDGKSSDGTTEILQSMASADARVRVLTNEQRRTPFAFNLGLREAHGQYVCIFGSHTIYKRDYIAVCLREITRTGAVGCGGRVVTQAVSHALQARLVAAALAHPFGSSSRSFRTQPEGFVDTVNYPVMRKNALLEVGGYSEELLRNEDNDMNQRLRAKGYRLFCTWKTSCIYLPKGNLKDLLSYAYENGFWNAVSFRKNADCMGIRHFVPFVFVLTLAITLLFAAAGAFLPVSSGPLMAAPFAVVIGLHLLLGSWAALQVAIRDYFPGALWLPVVFFAFHFSYGSGTLAAFLQGTHASRSAPARSTMATGSIGEI